MKWVKNKSKLIVLCGIVVYGFISVMLFILSKFIFNLLYGQEYNNVIDTFKILIIGFFFNATFKIPMNNILYSMKKLKFNLIVTCVSSVLNIILNIWFINLWGMNGAAISTTVINIIGSMILIYYVKKVIKEGENIKNEKNIY